MRTVLTIVSIISLAAIATWGVCAAGGLEAAAIGYTIAPGAWYVVGGVAWALCLRTKGTMILGDAFMVVLFTVIWPVLLTMALANGLSGKRTKR